MEWRDDILADLPDSPGDNEPETLRTEILEELGDHLQCAMNRELLNHGDPVTARKNVIERFGNVSQVARQMWFEAIRGQIMSQRLMIGMTAAMFVCCVAMGAFAFFSYSKVMALQELAMMQQRKAMEQRDLAMRSMEQAQEASHLTSLRLQEQLAEVANATPKSMDWNPFKVKLVDESGKAAPPGFKVDVHGKLHSENDEESLIEYSNQEGLADFEAIRPGNYMVYVTSPWGERLAGRLGQHISPGSDTVRKIICPSQPPQENRLTFKMEWPQEFADNQQPDIVALAYASSTGRTVANTKWQSNSAKWLAFLPDGRVFEAQLNDSRNSNVLDYQNAAGQTVKRAAPPFSGVLAIGEEITGKTSEFAGSKITVTPAILTFSKSPMEPGSESLVQMIGSGSSEVRGNIRRYFRGESSNWQSWSQRGQFYSFNEEDQKTVEHGEPGAIVSLTIADDARDDAIHHGFILRNSTENASDTTKRRMLRDFYTKDIDHDENLTRDEYGADSEKVDSRSWSPTDDEFPLTPKSMIASYDKWYAERRKRAATLRNGSRSGR